MNVGMGASRVGYFILPCLIGIAAYGADNFRDLRILIPVVAAIYAAFRPSQFLAFLQTRIGFALILTIPPALVWLVIDLSSVTRLEVSSKFLIRAFSYYVIFLLNCFLFSRISNYFLQHDMHSLYPSTVVERALAVSIILYFALGTTTDLSLANVLSGNLNFTTVLIILWIFLIEDRSKLLFLAAIITFLIFSLSERSGQAALYLGLIFTLRFFAGIRNFTFPLMAGLPLLIVIVSILFRDWAVTLDSNVDFRVSAWLDVISKVSDGNWLGHGFSHAVHPVVFDMYQFYSSREFYNRIYNIGAHNEVMQFIFRFGLVGAFLGAVVLLALAKTFYEVRHVRHAEVVIVLISVTLSVNQSISTLQMGLATSFLIGLLVALAERERHERLTTLMAEMPQVTEGGLGDSPNLS